MSRDKYGKTHEKNRELHILRDGRTAYCGAHCSVTYASIGEVHGNYDTCRECGHAKSSIDRARGNRNIATSGGQPD